MVLVRRAIGALHAACRGQAEELGEDKQLVMESRTGICRGLLGELGDDICLLLLKLLRQGLFLLGEASPVLLIDLLELS